MHLIANALALCGKTYEDFAFEELDEWIFDTFSIEKFAYFLLSPDFIEKYIEQWWWDTGEIDISNAIASSIGIIIYKYQSWNPEPLINLLTKIPWP